MLRTLCIVGAALSLAPLASAEIFKCTAKNGLALYQNFPCEIDSLGSLPGQPAPARPSAPIKSIQESGGGSAPSPAVAPRRRTEPQVGMTSDEVRTLWGEPAEIVQDEPRSGRVAIWQYSDGRIVEINIKQRVVSVQRQ